MILILFSLSVQAQTVIPTGAVNQLTYQRGGYGADSILGIPVRDTVGNPFPAFRMRGRYTLRPQDSLVYYHTGAKWVRVTTGGSGGGSVNSVTATPPITSTGGTDPIIGLDTIVVHTSPYNEARYLKITDTPHKWVNRLYEAWGINITGDEKLPVVGVDSAQVATKPDIAATRQTIIDSTDAVKGAVALKKNTADSTTSNPEHYVTQYQKDTFATNVRGQIATKKNSSDSTGNSGYVTHYQNDTAKYNYWRIGGNTLDSASYIGSRNNLSMIYIANNAIVGRLFPSGNWRFGNANVDAGIKLNVDGDGRFSGYVSGGTVYVNPTYNIAGLSGGSAVTGQTTLFNGGGSGYVTSIKVGNDTQMHIVHNRGGYNGIGIGHSTPESRMDIIGNPDGNSFFIPLRIRSGTLASTELSGAIENDGDHLYYTDDALNRWQLDQQGGGGGGGSVTDFIFTDGGGFDGTVSSSSTTPTLSLALQSNYNFVTDAEKADIGDIAGKEDVSNKVTSLASPNNTDYPTTQAVQDALDAIPALTDGDKGDISVSSSGTVWTIDAGAVDNNKISGVAWSKVSSAPTTLSGYGITDGVPTTRTISTTSPLSGGGDLSANRTLSIDNAAADGTTKGAASFAAADFNASSGNISIDYTNGQAASTSNKGFLTAADWNTFNGKGSGTVTSVGLSIPSWLSVSGSPVTTSGTLAVTAATGQTANQFLATPNGSTGAVGLRAIVAADIPTLNQNTTGSAASLTTTRTIWGQNFNGTANVTGNLALGSSSLTMTGSIAATGSRVTKGWFTDIESTNPPTVGGTALPTASSVTTLTNKTIAYGSNTITGLPETFIIACSDLTTAITTGTTKAYFRVPFACTVTAVRASLLTASSSGIPTFDINENGSTILSTKLTIDASEKTSTTAATPPVISDNTLAADAELTFDFDVAGTNAAGVIIQIDVTRN